MGQVRTVQEALREWNPIGLPVPPDEYDGYAHHIVSMVVGKCSVEQLSSHLSLLRTDTIGIEADADSDGNTAKNIITAIRGDAV